MPYDAEGPPMACPWAYPPPGVGFHGFPFLTFASDAAVVWPRSTIPSTGRDGSPDPREAGAAEAMVLRCPRPRSVSSLPIRVRSPPEVSVREARSTSRGARATGRCASVRSSRAHARNERRRGKGNRSGSIGKQTPDRKERKGSDREGSGVPRRGSDAEREKGTGREGKDGDASIVAGRGRSGGEALPFRKEKIRLPR